MAKMTASSHTMQFSVSEISKLTSVWSQEVLLFRVPWQVIISKREDGTQKSLAAFLYCANKDKSSSWTAVACATIKLLPFSDDQRVVEHYITPAVYHRFVDNFGTGALIQWNDLLNVDKKYVKDDTIQLEVKIEAEDPNRLDRSISKFNCVDKSCDCCCQATFELTVLNVMNLMAVRSSEIIMRDFPWYIEVCKNGTHLGVGLRLDSRSENASCQVTMTVKLVSSKTNVDPIEETHTEMVQYCSGMHIVNMVSWNDLLKPENGFVNGNSITLQIELKSDKPKGDVPNVNPNNVAKHRRLECSICLDEIYDQDMSITPCGHSFCTACITTAIRKHSVCPLCKEVVQLKDLRRLYFSAAK